MRSYTLYPLRFSPQPAAQIQFFQALGLHLALSRDDGTFATFRGRSGQLGVHSATETASGIAPGHTALNFVTDDLGAARDELAVLGRSVRVWDETYGLQGVVATPDGRVVGLHEETQEDPYGGYRVHEEVVAASMDVVAICFTDDLAAEAEFFGAFGFTGSIDNPWWVSLRAHPRSGLLGLHHGEAPERPTVRPTEDPGGRPYLVQVGFETSEPLDALAARLRGSGYRARTVEGVEGVHVVVTDPDGEPIEVHPTS